MFRKAALASLSLLAACTGTPAALPPDTTGVNRTATLTAESFSESDRALSCPAITAEREKLSAQLAEVDAAVRKQHGSNQVAYFIAGPLIAPAVGARPTDEQSSQMREVFGRRDLLVKLAAFKNCP
jgi:adenosylmethionine-8-amino-7-oxononanoate aminotransferase